MQDIDVGDKGFGNSCDRKGVSYITPSLFMSRVCGATDT